MRIRTLAIALALSIGATGLVQAAPKNPAVRRAKRVKVKKMKPGKRMKQAKATRVKARKAKPVKRAKL